jgi:PAS domain S-box-containing protein
MAKGGAVLVRRDVSQTVDMGGLSLEASLDPCVGAIARRGANGRIVDFEYVAVNELACRFMGLDREEILASSIRTLLPEKFATELVSWLAAVVETGEPFERHDLAFYNSGLGTMDRCDVRAVGEDDFVCFSYRDFNEARELADNYRLLLENSSDIVVRTNLDGEIEWVSDAVTKVLGYSPGEFRGQLLASVVHPEDVIARAGLRERFAGEESARIILRLRDTVGEYHHFGTLIHRVLDDQGTLSGFIAGLHVIDHEVAAREAAHKSEERHRLIAQYGTDVVALEQRGVIDWVSPFIEQLLDLSSDDVVGRSLADLVHPDDRASLQTFYRGIENPESLTLTVRMRMSDSTYRWVFLRSREVTDQVTGEKLRVSSWRDAQSDVAAQRALIASESRFRLLAENATDIVIECDARGVVHWVSPSSQVALGWRSDNVVGTCLDDYVFTADAQRVAEQRHEIATRQCATPVEVRYLTSTGNVKWMAQQMRQVRGLTGENNTFIVGLHDIDDEVTARFAKAESESSFRLLADNVTDVVYTVNLDGEIQWISPSVVEQLGWRTGDMVGHSVVDFVYSEDRARLMAWRQLLHLGEILDELTMRVLQSSGDFVWMKARAQPIRDADSRVTGVVVALRNCEAEVVTARALRTISAGSRVLVRVTDDMALLRQMCQIAVDEGGYLLAWYGQKMDDEDQTIRVVTSSAGHESYLEDLEVHWRDDIFGRGPTGRAIRTGQTCTTSDIETDTSFEPWRESARVHGFRSAAAIPVVVKGEVHGTWQVYAMEPRAFTPDVLTVLEDMDMEIGYGLARLSHTLT